MPKGTVKGRVENVTQHGASCTVTELTYDEAGEDKLGKLGVG